MLIVSRQQFSLDPLRIQLQDGQVRDTRPIPIFFPFIFLIIQVAYSHYSYPDLGKSFFLRFKTVLRMFIQERVNCKELHFFRDNFIYLARINKSFFPIMINHSNNGQVWISRFAVANGVMCNDISEVIESNVVFSCNNISTYCIYVSPGKKKINLNNLNFKSFFDIQRSKLSIRGEEGSRVYQEIENPELINGTILSVRKVIVPVHTYESYSLRSFPQSEPIRELEDLITFIYPAVKVDSAALYVGLSNNWYHFLVEVAPRIVQFIESNMNPLPVVVHSEAPKQIKQVCEIITGVPPIEVENTRTYHFNKLVVCFDRKYSHQVSINDIDLGNIFDSRREDLARVKTYLERFLNETSKEEYQLLFLARGSGKQRPLINFSEVCQLLESFGFQTIYLEKLSVVDQISLVSKAKFLIVEAGAAMTNILFASPNCKILRLEPRNKLGISRFWEHYAAILNLDFRTEYGYDLPGNFAKSDSYVLKLESLSKSVTNLLS